MRTMEHRARLLVLVAPLLVLAACGDDPKPKAPAAGQACPTEGTIEAPPVPTIREAVEPYMQSGHKFRLAERVSDTATVQLRADKSEVTPVVVTLVKTADGWAATSVARC